MSTDCVFDGSLPLDQEHAPEHPVAPLSVYGQSKAAGEGAVRTWPKHWIVRTSWVIGDGANSVRAMASLAERGIDPAVVDDQHGGVLPGPPRCGAASQELPAGSTGRCTGGARAAERLPVELLTLKGGASAWP